MRCRSSILLASIAAASFAVGCASTPGSARAEKQNCTTTKVTGSRLPRKVCDGDPFNPTLIDNRRSTERRSIEH